MKIGVSWGCYGKGLTAEKQLQCFKSNGFESTFLHSDAEDFEEIMPMLAREEIACESLHAPFGRINELWRPGESGERMLGQLMDGVKKCVRFGVPVLVVHLSSGDQAPSVNDLGISRLSRLMAFARSEGVTIAYENQRKLANIAVAMELFPEAKFCWDVGHEACFAYGREFMPLFGDRIAALHLHDNDGVHEGDLHLIPYDGRIDMIHAAHLLAKSGYGKSVMLELERLNSDRYLRTSPEDFYRRAAEAARRFAADVRRFGGN